MYLETFDLHGRRRLSGPIIELPRHTQKGLANPLEQSVFLTEDHHDHTTLQMIHAWDTGDTFTAECAALKLTAATAPSYALWKDGRDECLEALLP